MSGLVHAVDCTNSGNVGHRANDCSAYIHYETNSALSIEKSYNIKSITDQGTGTTDINYLRPLQNISGGNVSAEIADGDECCIVGCSSQVSILVGANDRNTCRMETRNASNASADTDNICIAVFS